MQLERPPGDLLGSHNQNEKKRTVAKENQMKRLESEEVWAVIVAGGTENGPVEACNEEKEAGKVMLRKGNAGNCQEKVPLIDIRPCADGTNTLPYFVTPVSKQEEQLNEPKKTTIKNT